MARTYKDVPRRVIEARNFEAGRIDHDHTNPRKREFFSYWPDRELSKKFPKGDTKAIAAHVRYLDSLGSSISYEIEEIGGNESYKREEARAASASDDTQVSYLERYFDFVVRIYEPKAVKFTVKRYIVSYETSYCTDLAHYDAATDTDTRDGGKVKCRPQYFSPEENPKSRRFSCSCCTYDKKVFPRTTVRQRLSSLIQDANGSGIDPDFSDALVEERYASKIWS